MEGTLETNYDRCNKISVTWTVGENTNNFTSHVSPPFLLISDRHPIIFSLSSDYENKRLNVKVQQGTSRKGRGIITISIERHSRMRASRTSLVEHWEREHKFGNVDGLPFSVDRWGDAILVIKCSITWLGFNDNRVAAKHPTLPLSRMRTPFKQDLVPNVKIIIGTEELSAHKGLLALHSPVLLAMFETPMKESKENHVVIEDIEFHTMEILLKLIATGQTEDLDDVGVAIKVLEAAEKYQMLMIKEACECKLELRVKEDNVKMLLDKADQYNAEELCHTCIEYVLANKEKIITCEELQNMCLKKPNLSAALLKTQISRLYLIQES